MPDIPDLPLLEEFHRRGIRPNRKLGQNFMVDRHMLDFLVRAANVAKADTVLEIGTGTGFLTQRLCESAGRVVSVEIDSGLYELSRERLVGFANLTLIHVDALSGEHSYADCVVRALESSPTPDGNASGAAQTVRKHSTKGAARGVAGAQRHRKASPDRSTRMSGQMLKVVSNLPYCIASAVVQTTFESRLPFTGMWVTCQKEVAERLTARPGDSEYGFISVLAALLADIRVVRILGPQVFWPRPKVDSAFVEIILRQGGWLAADRTRLRRVLSGLFSFRRKELGAAVRLAGFGTDDACRIAGALGKKGISMRERVFRLAPETFLEIAGAVEPISQE